MRSVWLVAVLAACAGLVSSEVQQVISLPAVAVDSIAGTWTGTRDLQPVTYLFAGTDSGIVTGSGRQRLYRATYIEGADSQRFDAYWADPVLSWGQHSKAFHVKPDTLRVSAPGILSFLIGRVVR